jgi:hypothetical protein
MNPTPRLAAAAAVALVLCACIDDTGSMVQAAKAGPCPGNSCEGKGIDLPDYGDNAVADWHETGRLAISPPGVPAGATASERVPTYDLDMSTLTVAMYDALALITARYQPLTPGLRGDLQVATPADGPSIENYAVHGAACTVLAGLFPSRASVYEGKCTGLQAAASGGEATAFGFGSAVGQRVLAWRADDGREFPLPPFSATPHLSPGEFRSLNPNPAVNPVNYNRSHVQPFSLDSADQFRADGPPALTSAEYAADLEQTRTLGGITSTVRTFAQTQRARFYTMAPPQYWMRNLLQFARSQPTLVDDARLMAAVWVAQADAITGCFDTKYHFLFWRPVTAINLGDPYGHAADPAWQPSVPTPNHPEYPSAHACASGATVEVLNQVFGTKKLRFSFVTDVANVDDAYKTQYYESTADYVNAVHEARITGGMHFHTSNVAGDVLGTKVAKQVMREHFQPLR